MLKSFRDLYGSSVCQPAALEVIVAYYTEDHNNLVEEAAISLLVTLWFGGKDVFRYCDKVNIC